MHCVTNERIHVFHDAARFGKLQLNNFDRKNLREDLFKHTLDFDKYVNFVGYFGHLYSGRGIEIIQGIAKKNLDCVFIQVKGDDGTHFEAIIVSSLFIDKSMIKQHQIVYEALGDMMKQEIHALSIKTLTPDQWKNN